jgi:hypothetical protein
MNSYKRQVTSIFQQNMGNLNYKYSGYFYLPTKQEESGRGVDIPSTDGKAGRAGGGVDIPPTDDKPGDLVRNTA